MMEAGKRKYNPWINGDGAKEVKGKKVWNNVLKEEGGINWDEEGKDII